MQLVGGFASRLVVALVLIGMPAHADEHASSPVRAGYEPTKRLLDFEARHTWDRRGFDPMLTYVSEMFLAPQLDNRVTNGGLLNLEIDLALSRLIGQGWGAVHLTVMAIHGRSPTTELMDVHGASGNTAPEDVRVYEAWFEQPIGAFTLRGGLLAADQEFMLAEQSSTLLSATFGITSQFSTNLIGPAYPVGSPGLSGRLELGGVTARLAIYDGTQANSHGIPKALGPAHLAVGELAVGPFKLGGWHHSARGNGVYAIANGNVEKYVGAFTRVGYSPDSPIDHYIDAGVRITPGTWRPDDFASLAIGYATTDAGAQVILEAMYEIQIRFLTIQPDFQILMLRERTVGIAVLRTTIPF